MIFKHVAKESPDSHSDCVCSQGGCQQLCCTRTLMPRDCCYVDHTQTLHMFVLVWVRCVNPGFPSDGTPLIICSVLLGGFELTGGESKATWLTNAV